MSSIRARRVCVFCGSSQGDGVVYAHAAQRVGRLLAARGVGIVYGGGHTGCMGALADAALAAGAEVIGVIPAALVAREAAHGGLTQLHVVETMHERKALMNEYADAFLALPGGFGTLEELFEVVTWRQLGYHRKPCAVLNVAGYYDALLRFCDHAEASGFVRPQDRSALLSGTEADDLIDALLARESDARAAS